MDDVTGAVGLFDTLRQDSWQNLYSGLGTVKDRREATTLEREPRLDYETCKELFRANAFAKKIAILRVDDALRDGWEVRLANDPKKTRKLKRWLEDLEVFTHISEALQKMRWSGGGAIFPIINGGRQSVRELTRPLDFSTINTIDGFRVFTSEELRAVAFYNGMLLPKYGHPAIYRAYPYALAPSVGQGTAENPPMYSVGAFTPVGTSSQVASTFAWPEIHESRLIPFSGPVADARQRIERWGWGDTCFDLLWKKIRDFDGAFSSISAAIDEFSVCVYRFNDLISLIDSGTAKTKVAQRLNILHTGKSLYRAIVLNKGDATGNGDETLERLNVPFTGIYEVLSMFMSWVAGAADYPVTRLFAQSPKGLGNEGESDIKNYNSTLTQFRTHDALPGIKKLLKFVFSAKQGPTKGKIPDEWEVVFPPLHSPTQEEVANTNLAIARTDDVYIKNGVLAPEEIRESHFGQESFSPNIELDDAIYKKFKEEQTNSNQQPATLDGQNTPSGDGQTMSPDGQNSTSSDGHGTDTQKMDTQEQSVK